MVPTSVIGNTHLRGLCALCGEPWQEDRTYACAALTDAANGACPVGGGSVGICCGMAILAMTGHARDARATQEPTVDDRRFVLPSGQPLGPPRVGNDDGEGRHEASPYVMGNHRVAPTKWRAGAGRNPYRPDTFSGTGSKGASGSLASRG